MPSFTVFKGNDSGAPKKSTTTKPDQLTGDNALVKVTASGLCGTDMHYKTTDMVLGHEGVGVVEAVGPDCKYLKKGDRVGWGYSVNSCGHCMECIQGYETTCPERELFGEANFDQGSMATHAVWHESFLHQIPDGLDDVHAAPLQCGGATVYTALDGVSPNDTVGIIGVGGLGHLAIQFAAKMGCKVVVFSGSDRKKDEASKLGASEFIATKGVKEIKISTKINRLLVTAASPPDWSLFIPIMAPRSGIYPLSVSDGTVDIPYMDLILNAIKVQGVVVGTRNVHRKMLEFAAHHQIKPIVELFPLSEAGIKQAMDKLDKGEMYYRGVLVPE